MSFLSKNEIKKRFIKLRNLEMLHPKARKRVDILLNENKELKQQVKLLTEIVNKQAAIIEKFKLRIEELEQMLFGKRRKKKPKGKQQDQVNNQSKQEKKPRDSSSYRRDIPNEEEITAAKDYHISHCPDCNTPLRDINLIVQDKEDIALLDNLLKQIEKQRIQTGYCPHCKQRKSAIPIRPQTAYLGENIKQFISYLITVLNLGFEKTKNFIKDLTNINISDGEISNILEKEAINLLPQYHKLKANIRGQPGAHYDETSWAVQQEKQGRFAWVMTGTKTTDAVFRLGQSRGRGNAEKLQGKAKKQVGISDDYGVYRNLFKYHQLCWAHPLRKLRDLANSDKLSEDRQKHCQKVYQSLNGLHQSLKEELFKPFNLTQKQQTKQKMIKQLAKIAELNLQDPVKLKTIKESLLKNKENYFTCLTFPGIPTTNNKAERNLRHLVLKRKNSFGSKTQKGADVMSVLCSVFLSLWWSKPRNFFKEYSKLRAYAQPQ